MKLSITTLLLSVLAGSQPGLAAPKGELVDTSTLPFVNISDIIDNPQPAKKVSSMASGTFQAFFGGSDGGAGATVNFGDVGVHVSNIDRHSFRLGGGCGAHLLLNNGDNVAGSRFYYVRVEANTCYGVNTGMDWRSTVLMCV